ncbi:putative progesterone-induced-blocking factor 1 isoform X1 [Apostichopus japonicus]|uniref:Putative progesterone-induced-blocking factor 1 isoform X1 n=1 Tax=Stichopus japonicus TaxID=307972 RepID=A0A2G8KEC0_STIJA|nr:putative progesterone-induced-blocking factor 1 isoform X1 [Apostichopus japonicus]
MARRDISSELDTEDISTSLATDLSISGGDESEFDDKRKDRKPYPGRITKQLIERKQLLHDVQLLKIEVSQKTLLIDNLKAEHMNQVEDLEENLSETRHQQKLLRAKLEAQLNLNREEAESRQKRLEQELSTIVSKQQELEKTNAELQRKSGDVRQWLHQLQISDTEYEKLASLKEDSLTLKDNVAMKLYEARHPLELELVDLKDWSKSLEDQLNRNKEENEYLKKALEKEERSRKENETKSQRLTLELADVKSRQQQDDYRRENYDKVKSERDQLETEYTELKKQHTYLEITFKNAAKERDESRGQLSGQKQELALLVQDKDYLQRQLRDVTSKYQHCEEKLQSLTSDLENAKRSREELYEKYVESRDRFKNEYEQRLQTELETIRMRTETELEKVKFNTRELYERENRNLVESRDSALMERDRCQAQEKETSTKYEQLLNDFRQLEMTMDSKVSELSNELRLRGFDGERVKAMNQDTIENLKKMQLELEKKETKLEVLTKEFYNLQNSSEKKIRDLEAETGDYRSRLDVYHKLEEELDDVVMQAADAGDESEAERVLFSYGYGANVPTTAKRRLQNSVHLARRVLHVEKLNSSLTKELNTTMQQLQQIGEELSSATSLLDQAQQPYNYLIDTIRSRDQQISKQKKHINALTEDVKKLKQEQERLVSFNNQMSADLERLLNQREQMAVMKQVVLSLSQKESSSQHSTQSPIKVEKLTHPLRQPVTKHGNNRDERITDPTPTVFTKQDPPRWHQKLKSQNGASQSLYRQAYKTGT